MRIVSFNANGIRSAANKGFFDWLEADTYEQTVRVDGTHQIDETIINPSYPDPSLDAGLILPASRIQLGPQLTQPTIQQASIGYERPLGEVFSGVLGLCARAAKSISKRRAATDFAPRSMTVCGRRPSWTPPPASRW